MSFENSEIQVPNSKFNMVLNWDLEFVIADPHLNPKGSPTQNEAYSNPFRE